MGFFYCLILLLGLCLNHNAMKLEAAGEKIPTMFVFGDSLVDVGNNNYLPVSLAKADFPHNGVDFPASVATGRFSNGKNSADFISEKVGLSTSPPYLSLAKVTRNLRSSYSTTGVSFASGGAGIFNGSDQTLGQSIPLAQQVEYFTKVYDELVEEMGASSVQALLSKTFFTIFIGSNDLFDYNGKSELRQKSSPESYVNQMALALKERSKRLYAYGARKFVFVGVPPLGCTPSQRVKNGTNGCNEKLNSWAVLYNGALKSMLKELHQELKDMHYTIFETYGPFHNLMDNPAKYGFNEVKSACCGLGNLNANVPCLPIAKYCSNRKDHVFWDLYHPTEATAKILVDTIVDGQSGYAFPLSLKQLIDA